MERQQDCCVLYERSRTNTIETAIAWRRSGSELCVHGLCPIRRWDGGVMHRKMILVPAIIASYNRYMNSVDKMDQLRSVAPIRRTEKSLHMSMFTWILDLSVHNAFSLFQHMRSSDIRKRTSFQQFKRRVMEHLVLESQLKPSTRPKTSPRKRFASAAFGAGATALSMIQGRQGSRTKTTSMAHIAASQQSPHGAPPAALSAQLTTAPDSSDNRPRPPASASTPLSTQTPPRTELAVDSPPRSSGIGVAAGSTPQNSTCSDQFPHILLEKEGVRLRCFLCSSQGKDVRVKSACIACGKGFHINCHAFSHNVSLFEDRPEIVQAVPEGNKRAMKKARKKRPRITPTLDNISLRD